MLRIIQNSSVAGAMNYFSTADYYAEGQELAGRWRGHGAALLGLNGAIHQREWDRLCQNRDPRSGNTLTSRLKANRRVGYDFNFRAPKGLSLLYGLTGDERLLDAFRSAVDTTMHTLERDMQTRVRRSGKDEDRTTGNMVWGEWIHMTGRPVDGVPDPHLHAHCFVFNSTWDSQEKRWKAGQFAGLKRDAPYFEAMFHSHLAEKLGDLGLAVARSKTGWDIADLSKDTLNKFSRRSAIIEKEAKNKGIVSAKGKMDLSTQTREKKRKEIPLPKLRKEWVARLSSDEAATLDTLTQRIGTGPITRDADGAERGANLAISHVFERKSVVSERMLLREAFRRSIGHASVEAAERAVRTKDLLLADSNGQRFATTLGVLSEETRMIDFARKGRGTCRAFVSGEYQFKQDMLNDQQRAAVLHVLRSRDRVMMIKGGAGVGKTTMMKETAAAIAESGTQVFTFAPSADASRGVLRSEGFSNADTLARLLKDEKLQATVAGHLIWVDEAGLVGTKTMKQLFDLADKINSRVVLSGDNNQHGSIERGDALRLLETEAGLIPAEIKEIQRQSGKYKTAVAAISEGRLGDGFCMLDDLEWIHDIPDTESRDEALASDYVHTVLGGKTCLVVSPTHAEGERVTQIIRNKLRYRGKLEGAEHAVLSLKNLSLTEADRSDPINYQRGDVLDFHQNVKDIKKGQRLEAGRDVLPLEQAKHFQAFRPTVINLAKGDSIRITQGGSTADRKHRVENGSIYKIKDFTARGDLILNNGWRLSKDWGHITHGYVTTSHASQGKTVKRVLIAQSATSFPASGLEQFYVSISRGKTSAAIYTDDKEALLEAVSRTDNRLAATDLMLQRHRDARAVVLRQTAERVVERQPERQRESMAR